MKEGSEHKVKRVVLFEAVDALFQNKKCFL